MTNGQVEETGCDHHDEIKELKQKIAGLQVKVHTYESALKAITEVSPNQLKDDPTMATERMHYVKTIEWIQALSQGVLTVFPDMENKDEGEDNA